MIKKNWASTNSKIVRNVDKMTLRIADLVYWWVINSVHMLGTSVAVTCHRICEMTAVWFPRRSLEALREKGRLLGFVSSCCPQPRWLSLELRSIPPAPMWASHCERPSWLLTVLPANLSGHLLVSSSQVQMRGSEAATQVWGRET